MKRLVEILGVDEETIRGLVGKIPTPKIRKVIELRLGLKDGMERTLKDVSEEMKINMELVRQFEARGLRFLRNNLTKKKSLVEIIKSFFRSRGQ